MKKKESKKFEGNLSIVDNDKKKHEVRIKEEMKLQKLFHITEKMEINLRSLAVVICIH